MISQVQAHLEAIYGLECEERAERFLVGREMALALGGTARADEELLVLEGEEGLELALYLAPELLKRLRAYEGKSPESVLEGALDSYCELAEGVSHFLYLTHASALGRTVSLLELEVQAEVDKFATCVLLGWKASDRNRAEDLHHRLFDKVSYRSTLTPDERSRYVEANRLSRNYCRGLFRHISQRRLDRLLSDLRYSYRLGAAAKLHHLGRSREMLGGQ